MGAVLVTGAAGFIGAHLCRALLARGEQVVGLDNLNPYYDPALKQARLAAMTADAAPGAFRFHRIDLADVARRAAGILTVRAQERGISIDAPKPGEHLPAIAEFRRVLQILLNLVGNAIRYAPDNSQVWIRLEDAGSRARLVVADQGPGLSSEQQVKVFEKFERLGRSNEDGGSGLGLYISRRLARAMGGDLMIDSAPGQGARFILEVPADLLALRPTTAQQPESDCAE